VIALRNGGRTFPAIGAWIVLIVASATLLLGAILDLGFFPQTRSFNGPFAPETSGSSHCFVAVLGKEPGWRQLFAMSGDTPGDPYQSTLKLWINGRAVGPAHSIHEDIRKQGGGRYSHWGDVILFSLPAGITNGPSTTALVEYSRGLPPVIRGFGWLALVSSAAFLAFRSWRLHPERLRSQSAISGRLAGVLGLALFCAAAVGTSMYLLTIAIGVAQGYALPNTAVFRLFPSTRQIAMYEPALHYVITYVAMAGAVLAWGAPSAFQKHEGTLIRYWNRYGLVAIAALFLFSLGATWSGLPRTEDLQSNAVGGLVPLSDAQRHYEMAFNQVITGHWAPFAEQRPFAAAHRALLLFLAGYSNVPFLALQALTIACATYAATRAVMLWRGLWSGLMFFGLTLALVRPYLSTYLTEPLGQFWILLSIPFVIRLLRRGTVMDGAVSLLAVTMALLTRMGSMFTIPAFAVWLAWTESRDRKRLTLVLLTIAAVLLGCSLVSVTLLRLYGSGTGFLGSNFSFVICGATHGGDWTTCRSLYQDELRKVGSIFDSTQTHFLYAKAWEGFRRDPSVLFHRLLEGEQVFLRNLLPVVLGGYTTPTTPRWFPRTAWTVIAACGLMVTFWRRREKRELSFWLVMWLGLLASAPLVFFASGFATQADVPSVLASVGNGTSKCSLAALSATMSVWIAIPGLAHWLDPLHARMLKAESPNPGERVVPGGGTHMAGFLVVADDQPVPIDVPAMRRSDLTKLLEYSGHEALQKLRLPDASASFAFIVVPNANGTYGTLFVAPSEVFTRRNVPAWRLTVKEEVWEEEDAYIGRVTAATPVAGVSR
jgi:hypothetical protein